MKKVFKIILIVVCFVLAVNLTGTNNAQANTNKTATVSNENSCLLVFVRVQEGARVFIHVYTSGGTYIMKYEEL